MFVARPIVGAALFDIIFLTTAVPKPRRSKLLLEHRSCFANMARCLPRQCTFAFVVLHFHFFIISRSWVEL